LHNAPNGSRRDRVEPGDLSTCRPQPNTVHGVPTVVHGEFEWDADKAAANASKHGVTFEEAAVAMTDPMAVDFNDRKYPDRLITVAISPLDRILYVVTTESGARTRIISARRATSHERRIYEEGD
jgi:uncharacterized DUF497 family protein